MINTDGLTLRYEEIIPDWDAFEDVIDRIIFGYRNAERNKYGVPLSPILDKLNQNGEYDKSPFWLLLHSMLDERYSMCEVRYDRPAPFLRALTSCLREVIQTLYMREIVKGVAVTIPDKELFSDEKTIENYSDAPEVVNRQITQDFEPVDFLSGQSVKLKSRSPLRHVVDNMTNALKVGGFDLFDTVKCNGLTVNKLFCALAPINDYIYSADNF